ncbi:MAG: AAA family ATPase [Nitrospiraceae bacterium]|nr:AAA family ATPase [Nitrospiraceae bacterium]
MRIGLCGSHRTGKTTLAEAVSKKTGIPFVRTSTSEVFRRAGLDPAASLDFNKRLWIQNETLEAAKGVWEAAGKSFITDRTPVDMMAYTLGDIQGSTQADFNEVEDYLERCFTFTNRFFDALVIVQPGIPLVHEQGKAALNRAYIEHLNYLILGLTEDPRRTARVIRLGRETMGINDRVKTVFEGLGI